MYLKQIVSLLYGRKENFEKYSHLRLQQGGLQLSEVHVLKTATYRFPLLATLARYLSCPPSNPNVATFSSTPAPPEWSYMAKINPFKQLSTNQELMSQ